MAKYLIHSCPRRYWYVRDYLIPDMKRFGIPEEDITVYNDYEAKGNLVAFMDSLKKLPNNHEGTWHLQDDILLSENYFKAITERFVDYDGIVCGFACRHSRQSPPGKTTVENMWWSFPCIYIPNYISVECSEWFYNVVVKRTTEEHRTWLDTRKYDDAAFKQFVETYYPDIKVYNINPNIVNHVDYLLGGSTLHPRGDTDVTSIYWNEPQLIQKLIRRLRGLAV
jgi:hypothetical protein